VSEYDLFSAGDLREALEAAKTRLREEVLNAPEDYLLNVDLDEWVRQLAETHSIEPLVLKRDEMYFEDLGEVQVDVRYDHFLRAISDLSRPAYVAGRAVELHVPFSGEAELLRLRPNMFGPILPRGRIENFEIVKYYSWPTDTARPDLDGEANQFLNAMEQWIGWSAGSVASYNDEVAVIARQTIVDRRRRVLADHAHLDDIGIPVRRRGDAPKTYAAPGIVRRAPPAPVAKPQPPRAPEPTMVGTLYEHTLGLIRSWGKAVERTPAPYVNAEEETLRDALLPMLNSHYEGAATGETFNASGKIDILIRIEDRSVFIGECKWWSGPAGFGEALDQVFSYTTWRDTKVALIFFVDRKDPTAVLEKVRGLLAAHELFVEWGEAGDERELHATMRWPGDASITAQLHVFFVHLPK
jgi:hypothetical protein